LPNDVYFIIIQAITYELQMESENLMKGRSDLLLKRSLFFAGLMAILVFISVPVTAEDVLISARNDGGAGLSSAFLNGYSSSGITLPKSPSLGTSSLLSGYTISLTSGTGTPVLPGTGSSSATLGLISSALGNYKTSPTAFKDYSYISSYMPTCYGV
jgi:hypothetical protein